MTEFLRDLRFGLRLLVRSPAFTATAALLLAIGISANTLIFSVVDALLLRALPVARPEELVRLVEVHPNNFLTWDLPYGLYETLAARGSSLSEALCQGDADVGLREGGSTERVRVNLVSSNFFSSLGVSAQLGRVLTPEDERAEVTGAVLSHNFWRRRFQGDPAILGRTLTLNGRPFVVIGVLPRQFNGLTVDTSPDVRVPVTAHRWLVDPLEDAVVQADVRLLRVQIFGRLRPGITLERADAENEPLLRSTYEDLLARESPKLDAGARKVVMLNTHFRLEPAARGVSALRQQFSRGLVVLMAGVGLLLVMACANVAGLLLARSAVRREEMGIRRALGATSWRLARQLLTESLLVAALGGFAGMLLSYACLPLLVAALPPIRDRAAVVQPLAAHIHIDIRALGFAIAATLLTAVLSGLPPALRGARADLATALRGGRTTTKRLAGGGLVVVAQIAICTLLVAGAVLLVETLDRMRSMNPGFDRDHIVTFTIDPRMRGYKPDRSRLLSSELLEKTHSLPSVDAASIAGLALMRGTGVKGTFGAAGTPIGRNDFLNTSLNFVTPGYFETMGMRLVAGRDFTWSDENKQTPRKVIVNQTLARRFFPGEYAIGKRLGSGLNGIAKPDSEIIGVVSDAKYRSLREEIQPTVYSPVVNGFDSGFILHLRTHRQPEAIIGPVRDALRSLDPELPFVEVRTLRQEVETSLWQEKLLAALSSIFGAIAALLAAIGLYGALDFAVKARTREIGVRVALGADPARIVRLLSGEMLLLVTAGIVLGFAAYGASARWIRQVLYEVRPSDPVALGSALLLIATTAVLAAVPPIWRAVRINPASALRQE